MKNTTSSVKKEAPAEVPAVSDRLDDQFPQWESADKPKVDPFDTTLLGSGIPNYVIDPSSLENAKFPPIDDPNTMEMLQMAAKIDDERRAHSLNTFHDGTGIEAGFDRDAAWIQTHSGRRFNPTKPNPNAIVIQDIAHALSMQCRFSGHCRKFYSVAQHSVLVSYICDSADALWGLLHDASEAYLVDVPRPLKRSGKFNAYIEFETQMQEAICRRFGLPFQEPPSVKKADTVLLATEARDLMAPLHPDWVQPVDPLPFLIEPWGPDKAKDMFMKRFFELIGADKTHYEHYLRYRDKL